MSKLGNIFIGFTFGVASTLGLGYLMEKYETQEDSNSHLGDIDNNEYPDEVESSNSLIDDPEESLESTNTPVIQN